MSSLTHREVRPSGTTLTIPAHELDRIHRHAVAGFPFEVVGLLAGRRADGWVSSARPLENAEANAPARRYAVGPMALLQAEQEVERAGLEVVGFYHSHPNHPAMWSDTDRDLAMPNTSYLIVSVAGGRRPHVADPRAWRLRHDRSVMDAERIEVETPPPIVRKTMPVQVSIPSALRPYVGGQAVVALEAASVSQALSALTDDHDQLARHLRDETGELRSFVNVYLNGEDIRFLPDKDATALQDGDSLVIVPSIAGGR